MFSKAKFIKCPFNIGTVCPMFSKSLKLKKEIRKAILTATAVGVYNAYINGVKVGDRVLAPYWTSYPNRLQYQSYDVSNMLTKNARVSFTVAGGWAVGSMGWFGHNHFFADHVSLKASLDVTYTDGTKEAITTDDSWDVYTSEIQFAEIYHGETVDHTAKIKNLGKAMVDTAPKTRLVKQIGQHVTEHDRVAPVELIITPLGEKVLDFGQNMAGYVEVRAKGKKGDRIVMKHFEVLDKDGNVYTKNLRSARQLTTYVLSGEGEEKFKPCFSFQGFRYVKLEEYYKDDIDLSDFTAIAVHSDMKRTGSFSCGVAKLNQLYSNMIWGNKSNFVDVPTDCPQRDERCGWAGDAQVFCSTAAINYDVEKFFEKWLGDVALEQSPEGAVEGIIPLADKDAHARISSAWGDVATVGPWQMYLAYGNKKTLSRQFEMMRKWVDFVRSCGDEEYLWLSGGKQYGDWLAPDAPGDTLKGSTDEWLIASAFFYHSTDNVVKAGEALGYDVEEYKALRSNIKKAFCEHFTVDGLPTSDTQTACALMLYFGLCEDEKKVADRLEKLVIDAGYTITTGFVGTPYLLFALSIGGKHETAYTLLLQEKYASWLYSVNRGATTIWEHWDGINEEGDMWRFDMNSFNHYAYGSVFAWVYGVAAGIEKLADGAGYKHIAISPRPDRRLGFINCGIDTKQGRLESNWAYTPVGNLIRYDMLIPEGTVANVTLPDGQRFTVGGGRYTFHTKA